MVSIGDYAFYNSSFSLENAPEVQIGDSVVRIGSMAFYYQKGMGAITLPSSLEEIGDYAFYNCTSLAALSLPSKLERIGSNAFRNVSGWLNPLALPEGLTSVGSYAFAGCGGIQEINYISAEARTFALTIAGGNDPLTNAKWLYEVDNLITLPVALTEIDEEAFDGSAVEQVRLPVGIHQVGDRAFANNGALRVLIVEGMETIFSGDVLEASPNAIVYCNEGSAVEAWCVSRGVRCVAK